MSWHADAGTLERYATGALDDANAYSIEAHLLSCDDCRAALPRDARRLDAIWSQVRVTTAAPRPGLIERALRGAGVRDHTARLLAATPALGASWLLGVAVTLAFAVLASHNDAGNPLPFLLVAPVLPLAGVATAYGPGIDPTYEIGASAPMRGLRLLMVRATAVFGFTGVLAAAASLALPTVDATAALWVLPALALAICSLALTTWFPPVRSAVIVSSVWAAIALAGFIDAARFDVPVRIDTIAWFRTGGQGALAATAVLALMVLLARRNRLDQISE